jgi:hypothetical protein
MRARTVDLRAGDRASLRASKPKDPAVDQRIAFRVTRESFAPAQAELSTGCTGFQSPPPNPHLVTTATGSLRSKRRRGYKDPPGRRGRRGLGALRRRLFGRGRRRGRRAPIGRHVFLGVLLGRIHRRLRRAARSDRQHTKKSESPHATGVPPVRAASYRRKDVAHEAMRHRERLSH